MLFAKYFNVGFTFDGVKAITAGKILEAGDISYWIKIFTTPIHAEQYRPLSLFAYFYFISKFFGENPEVFRIIFVFLVGIISLLAFELNYKFTRNKLISIFGVLIFLTHAGHQYMVYEISHHLKYYGPLLFLLLSLRLADKHELQNREVLWILAWLILSIMSHEGSFIFPLLIILYRFLQRKTFLITDFYIFMPFLCWLYVRWFVWGVPVEGEFQVDFLSGQIAKWIYYLSFSYGSIFYKLADHGRAFDSNFYMSEIFLLIFVIFLYIFFSRKIKIMHFVFWSSIIVLIPFVSLKNHIFANRAIWSTLFASFFWVLILDWFAKRKSKKINISVISIVLLLTILNFSRNKGYYNQISEFSNLKEVIKRIHELENNEVFALNVNIHGQNMDDFFYELVLPGHVALSFPTKEIQLRNYMNNQLRSVVVVKSGVYYLSRKEIGETETFRDPFQVNVSRHFIKRESIMDIELKR